MEKVPPFASNEVDDDDDDSYEQDVDVDVDVLNGGGLAWAHSAARSVTSICTVSFVPLPPLALPSATSAPLPPPLPHKQHLVASTVSWQMTQDSR